MKRELGICPCCGMLEDIQWYPCKTCEEAKCLYGNLTEDCPECCGDGGGYLCQDCARLLGYYEYSKKSD